MPGLVVWVVALVLDVVEKRDFTIIISGVVGFFR